MPLDLPFAIIACVHSTTTTTTTTTTFAAFFTNVDLPIATNSSSSSRSSTNASHN